MRLDIDRKTLVGMLAGAVITVIVVVLLRGLFGGTEEPGTAIEDIRPKSADAPASQQEDDTTRAEDDVNEDRGEDAEEFVASQEPPDIAVPLGKGLVECPEATVTVADATELAEALEAVEPGAVIRLEPGVYSGRFVAAVSGTEAEPIFVCGPPEAIIDGGGIKKGYAFHLNEVDHWRLVGFTVRNSQKGVMADRTGNTIIQQLTVHHIGDEAIHLRNFSSDNTVQYCMIYATGLRREKFGEGVYLGTAESNWAAFSGGQMDRSDRNTVRGNVIRATAEAIDIKEGTSDGHIVDNIFDGSKLGGHKHNDSWVDVKGNGYLIRGNTGSQSNGDGFQTHKIVNGWGTGNVFQANTIDLGGSGGFGINDTVGGNTITCDNKVTGGALSKADDCS
ncbi:right-handed parallel beta-helix repeat-containing protein [Streptosporangium sp. NPDC050280]|uniref:right-handed parallel beta-helix repeat-containing protein n=1 Tax=unclassified Streptosporangium TaxID=2632669 RepID=UPI0034253CC4